MSYGGDGTIRPIGRDEMNLAEFPITLITDRVPKGMKTLVFEGRNGTLTVTGSDAYGLPTAPDADVIVGLLALTKAKNDFADATVPFTRHELLRLLGWPDRGQYYRRLDESLRRWVGVTLRYDGAWWDAALKCRVDALFHVLDCVTVFDGDVRRTLRGRGRSMPPSTFTWSKTFFQSCRADNLKRLDLDVYRSLGSAVSRQLYRFLDKRFHVSGDWTFGLGELAFNHVGMSRNYTPAKIKEKLRPAIAELESIGFIEPMPNPGRYAPGARRGEWKIRFARKASPAVAEPPRCEPIGLTKELVDRGVTRSVAVELVGAFPEDHVRAQIDYAEWTAKRKKIRDMGSYLAGAIRKDYAPPAGYKVTVESARDERSGSEDRSAKARDRADHARVRAYVAGLSVADLERLDEAAVAHADEDTRASLESEVRPVVRRMLMVPIREAYVQNHLDPGPAASGRDASSEARDLPFPIHYKINIY